MTNPQLKYYEVFEIGEEFVSKGTFETFQDALQVRIDIGLNGTIRYWNGEEWIMNVDDEQE